MPSSAPAQLHLANPAPPQQSYIHLPGLHAYGMYSIAFYTPADRSAWNAFVRQSRNGVFLFEREYMDYHADRFEDASVVIRNAERGGKIVAVLPAHRKCTSHGMFCISHGGLTFGGLVMDARLGGEHVPSLMRDLTQWLSSQGYAQLHYKPVPHIYHRLPSEDDLYALHQLGARTTQVLFSSTLDLQRSTPSSSQKQRALNIASRHGITVTPCTWEAYWPLLTNTLQRRHATNPVHTLDEIRLLASAFPQLEVLGGWGAANADGSRTLHAGIVLFHYDGVTHTQYLASSPEGFESRAQHAILDAAIDAARQRGQRWFSFGTSTTEGGTVLNEGLVRHKEMFGARTTILQTLVLDL